MSSRKREDVWLKPEINECYFGRICIYLWHISSSASFVSIWLLLNSYPYPKCHRLFTRGFQFGQVPLPLVSRVHFQGICQNRFLYLIERSSEALVTLFWETSSIKSEEISANGMPCPGGMSVGIRSSFCWLYWSSSQVLHAFVVMVVISWYNPSHLRCWPLAWFSLFLLVAFGGWPKYISAALQEW